MNRFASSAGDKQCQKQWRNSFQTVDGRSNKSPHNMCVCRCGCERLWRFSIKSFSHDYAANECRKTLLRHWTHSTIEAPRTNTKQWQCRSTIDVVRHNENHEITIVRLTWKRYKSITCEWSLALKSLRFFSRTPNNNWTRKATPNNNRSKTSNKWIHFANQVDGGNDSLWKMFEFSSH